MNQTRMMNIALMMNIENFKWRYLLTIWMLLNVISVKSQDVMPSPSEADKPLEEVVEETSETKETMSAISVGDSMPVDFLSTSENVILDPENSLSPFWRKLSVLDRPLRILHIGDSHVRGHIFPYVMRCCLENDFGHNAVVDTPVSYRTSGLAHETGQNGIVYHILGVNGATCSSYATPDRMEEVVSLHPDLVILSFGTNEAHGMRYMQGEHEAALGHLVNTLKQRCPDARFLLTTPPGAYVRKGRSQRVKNPRTQSVVDTEMKFAKEHGLAIWNLYQIAGGKSKACSNWVEAGMFQRDKIHFTREGYTLQGLLFHEAFIKAYNDYVAAGLE